jgi:hypothetical protein
MPEKRRTCSQLPCDDKKVGAEFGHDNPLSVVSYQVFRKMQNDPATCSQASKPPFGATSVAGAAWVAGNSCSMSEGVEIARKVLLHILSQIRLSEAKRDAYGSVCEAFSLRLCASPLIDFSIMFVSRCTVNLGEDGGLEEL